MIEATFYFRRVSGSKSQFMYRLIIGILVLFMLPGCEDRLGGAKNCRINNPEGAVTFSQGVFGNITFTEGNCMPGIGANRSCQTCPVRRMVRFYELTLEKDAVRAEPTGSFYLSFSTRLVGETESDLNGFYQINLPPGKYTMVVVEDAKLYASFFNGDGSLNPITVVAGTNRADFGITYKAVY